MTRALLSEALGSALLLVAVVGSGIMADTLSAGNTGVALLANAIATACGLYVLITVLGPVSGAHFNPAVSLVMWRWGDLPLRRFLAYVPAQIGGAVAGVWLAHAMFGLPILQVSIHDRTGGGQWLSEAVATFGLIFTILGGLRQAPAQVPGLVAAWIAGAYWFTASTSFANPAVTIARGLSDTFAGISPAHVPAFVLAQLVAALVAAALLPRLLARP